MFGLLALVCWKIISQHCWFDIFISGHWLHLLFCVSVDEDGMDCLDNERRPHFPQFSYSASGREWVVHCFGDIITAGLWGHHCGTKRPMALDWPRSTMTWRILPFSSSSSLFHLSTPFHLLLIFIYFCESPFYKQLQGKITLESCTEPP